MLSFLHDFQNQLSKNIADKGWFCHHVVLKCSFIRSIVMAKTLALISCGSLLWISLPLKSLFENTKVLAPEGHSLHPTTTRRYRPGIVLLLLSLLQMSFVILRAVERGQSKRQVEHEFFQQIYSFLEQMVELEQQEDPAPQSLFRVPFLPRQQAAPAWQPVTGAAPNCLRLCCPS